MTTIARLKVLSVLALIAYTPKAAFPQSENARPCTSSEFRQFDFWVGDWDVFEGDGAMPTARVRVDRALDGCVLRERYDDKEGLRGESFSIYDAARRLWHQTWVTNRAQLLTIEGAFTNGEMILAGVSRRPDGKSARVRGAWKPTSEGVRETAVASTDDGKTWKPWFDLSFRSHEKARATPDGDARTIAALDENFQAAVKANDAETMDNILADDFVLVTGSGKVYNKSDLLQEARNHSSVYEHQEDTDRTVRIWGDTAVVTAKLWIKGVREGKPIDYILWFSDTYVRTLAGWRYVFGQASLPLAPRSSEDLGGSISSDQSNGRTTM